MLTLVVFVLSCYGATSILTTGAIFEPIRARLNKKFLRCSQCVGFWVGIVFYCAFHLVGVDLFPEPFVGVFLFGCISSGASYILSSIVDDDGLKIKHLLKIPPKTDK